MAINNKYRHSTLTINGHGGEVVSALGYERFETRVSIPSVRSPILLPLIKNKRVRCRVPKRADVSPVPSEVRKQHVLPNRRK